MKRGISACASIQYSRDFQLKSAAGRTSVSRVWRLAAWSKIRWVLLFVCLFCFFFKNFENKNHIILATTVHYLTKRSYTRNTFWFYLFIFFFKIQLKHMEEYDFAGRTKLPRGPHVARGPQVGKVCNTTYSLNMSVLHLLHIGYS